MKSRTMALAIAIFILAFTASSTIMAQSKDSKTTDSKVKTTVQKIDSKTTKEVKQDAGTTIHHKNYQLKERTNTVKNEVKTDLGKDMKKTGDEVKKNDMITHKTEKRSNTK
ncbi:MAG: hypothetical protein ABI638_01985 [Ignavibacteriota bacterium]